MNSTTQKDKKAFIHVGLEKCASTSLQHALLTLRPEQSITSVFENPNLVSERINSGHNVLYISDERLSWCDAQSYELKDSLENAGYNTRTIVILRNPLRFAVSLYLESIKWGEINDFTTYLSSSIARLNYDSMITKIENIFGKTEYLWLDDTVVQSALSFMDINDPVAGQLVKRINAVLPDNISSVLIEINRLFKSKEVAVNPSREILAILDKSIREKGLMCEHYGNIVSIDIRTLAKLMGTLKDSHLFIEGLGRST